MISLQRKNNPVEEMTFLKTMQNLDATRDRVSSFGILCKEEEGNHITFFTLGE